MAKKAIMARRQRELSQEAHRLAAERRELHRQQRAKREAAKAQEKARQAGVAPSGAGVEREGMVRRERQKLYGKAVRQLNKTVGRSEFHRVERHNNAVAVPAVVPSKSTGSVLGDTDDLDTMPRKDVKIGGSTLRQLYHLRRKNDPWSKLHAATSAVEDRKALEKKQRMRRLNEDVTRTLQMQEDIKRTERRREVEADKRFARHIDEDTEQWKAKIEADKVAELERHKGFVRAFEEHIKLNRANRARERKEKLDYDLKIVAAAKRGLAREQEVIAERKEAQKAYNARIKQENEVLIAKRARQKLLDIEEDKRLDREYLERVQAEDRRRMARLDGAGVKQEAFLKQFGLSVQAQQAKLAAEDEARMMRQWRESEAAKDAEEARRKEKAERANREQAATLKVQMLKRGKELAIQNAEDSRMVQWLLKKDEEAVAAEREAAAKRHRAEMAYREKLVTDIEATRRHQELMMFVGMSDREYDFNKKMLAGQKIKTMKIRTS